MLADKEIGNKIAEQAVTWLGTPHKNAQMVKGAGVDCALLPFACIRDCGLISGKPEDFGIATDYSCDWYLYRDGVDMIKSIEKFFTKVEDVDYHNGDLIVYQFGRAISHTAIIIDIDKRLAIHADARVGEVIYLDIDDYDLSKRQRGIYRLNLDKINKG